jgi:hypothetical protein
LFNGSIIILLLKLLFPVWQEKGFSELSNLSVKGSLCVLTSVWKILFSIYKFWILNLFVSFISCKLWKFLEPSLWEYEAWSMWVIDYLLNLTYPYYEECSLCTKNGLPFSPELVEKRKSWSAILSKINLFEL